MSEPKLMSTQDVAPSTVTAAQLITLAANVNDQRVITEAIALATLCGVEAPIASITYQPALGSRSAKLAFTTYELDPDGKRYVVHDDGSPYDPALGKPYRTATKQSVVNFRGELPSWWDQAVRIAVLPPGREGHDER